MIAAGELVGAAHLALLDHRDRHVAERLEQLRLVLEQLQQPHRAGQAGGAAADDRDADLDPLVLGVGRRPGELADRVDRRRELARRDPPVAVLATCAQPPRLAFTASVSLGTILLRSPTTPRSENSKIGASASLLMATMFSEFCIPTLCWIAPEMPAAR